MRQTAPNNLGKANIHDKGHHPYKLYVLSPYPLLGGLNLLQSQIRSVGSECQRADEIRLTIANLLANGASLWCLHFSASLLVRYRLAFTWAGRYDYI